MSKINPRLRAEKPGPWAVIAYDIFHVLPKPHLRLQPLAGYRNLSYWYCFSGVGIAGCGQTPKKAYADWKLWNNQKTPAY